MDPLQTEHPDLPDVFAYALDGEGHARSMPLADKVEARPSPDGRGFVWIHLRRDHPEAQDWLQQCGLDRFVIEALTAEETRPRCTVIGTGVLLNLRGVNLNPGAEPDDMVSVRLWIEDGRVIGVWLRPLMAIRDLLEAISRGRAPVSPGDLVAKLALRLADRAEPTVAALNEHIDRLEEAVEDPTGTATRAQLAEIRRASIVLRRYMFPQRDALTTLQIEDLDWLDDRDRGRIREAAERVTRLGEELDSLRDRAQVVQDQIMDRRAELMNRHMLVLSVVAAIFLPLGLLTGLLGINVGGIPGADNPWAFLIVCGLLVGLGAALALYFRRLKLLG